MQINAGLGGEENYKIYIAVLLCVGAGYHLEMKMERVLINLIAGNARRASEF